MNGKVMRRMIAVAAAAVVIGLAADSARAGWSFSFGTRSRGATWVTQTRYRTELRAVKRTFYRVERKLVTVWTTERRLAKEAYCDRWGRHKTRLVWKDVRVPRREIRTVRVPYEKVVYETVKVPYTTRVRSARPTFSISTRKFSACVGNGGFGVTLRGGSRDRDRGHRGHRRR